MKKTIKNIRSDSTALFGDPRWQRMYGRVWYCPSCRKEHEGITELSFSMPDCWDGDPVPIHNSGALHSTHFLSEDFCVLEGQHFFLRSILAVPLIGSGGDDYAYGIWSQVTEDSFELYCEVFDNEDFDESIGPFGGLLANNIKTYSTSANLKGWLYPQPDRMRPRLVLEESDHPLSKEQRNGITFERLLDIQSAHGHDLRAALLQ